MTLGQAQKRVNAKPIPNGMNQFMNKQI